MKLTVIGAGATGGTIGAHRFRAGHDITLCDADTAHVAAIKEHGLRIEARVNEFNLTRSLGGRASPPLPARHHRSRARQWIRPGPGLRPVAALRACRRRLFSDVGASLDQDETGTVRRASTNMIMISVRNGFFTDDQAAIRARAQHDGFGYVGGPVTPGLTAIRQPTSRFAAASLHPPRARELIYDGARHALQRLDSCMPRPIELPATWTVRFRNGDIAEMAAWLRGVQRVDEKTVNITDDDPLGFCQTFLVAVLLTRGIAE
jgi:D-aminopeptidase/Methylaspartate ammonia-lyase N-terminus/Ketopantoate reductase PanE/ApbA